MTFKLLIVFACAAGGLFCGYTVLLTYKKSFAYLSDVCMMISELRHNLSYRNDPVPDVLRRLSYGSPQLKRNIAEYVDYIDGKTDTFDLGKGYLSKATYAEVAELFGALGMSDGKTQSDMLSAYSSKFEERRAEAEKKYNKYGAVAVKLGFLLGLGVGILAM